MGVLTLNDVILKRIVIC